MPTEKFSFRLYKALSKANITQAHLCKETGITKSAMSQYLKGSFEPKQNRISAIARALNVSEAWLMGFDVPMNSEKADEENPVETVTAFTTVSGDNPKTVYIPTVCLNGIAKEKYCVINVTGDSMYPLYLNGDKVLILKQTEYSDETVCAVSCSKNSIILRKITKTDNGIVLTPINPEYMPNTLNDSELDDFEVIGLPKLVIREVQ